MNMNEKLKYLRESGKLNSLNDKEIDLCFIKATISDQLLIDRLLKSTKITWLKSVRHFLKVSTICFGAIFAILLLLCSQEGVKNEVVRLGHNYMYPMMRTLRIAALPFIRKVHLSGYHEELCLLDNPYYEHSISNIVCHVCEQTPSFDSLKSIDSETFEARYIKPMRSVLIKDTGVPAVTFDDIQTLFHENPQLINSGINTIISNKKRIPDHHYLMYNTTAGDITSDENFHLQWITRRVGPSRFFMKLFPKPEFFPGDRQMALEKILLLDSYNSNSFTLPHKTTGHMLYTQGSGKRILKFRPLAKCVDMCKSFTVNLQAGDMVFMHRVAWNVESQPMTDTDQEMSVALIATF